MDAQGKSIFDAAVRDHRAGQLELAVTGYRNVLKRDQTNRQARNNLAVALRALGRSAEAERLYAQMLNEQPEDETTCGNLINLLIGTRRPRDALAALTQCAAAVSDRGKPEAAERLYRRGLQIDPNEPVLHNNLGNALLLLKRPQEALACFDRALQLNPRYRRALTNKARALTALNQLEDALEHYRRAADLDPNDHTNLHDLALSLKQLGRLDEARPLFDKVLTLKPDFLPSLIEYSRIKKLEADTPHFQSLLKHAQNIQRVVPDVRPVLLFSIAKGYNDSKRYEEAITTALRGAASHRLQIKYDEKQVEAFYALVRESFSKELFEKTEGVGDPDATPVFILGMPRSGTTLTDQIIVSHPQGASLGETDQLRRMWNSFLAAKARPLNSATIAAIEPGDFAAAGQSYVAEMHANAGGGARIVEKEPSNFGRVGLIHLLLPQAKILHCVRNPVDTCVSCLFQKFHDDAQGWSYELGELGRYFRGYLQMMDHWREVLPGRIMDVVYEETIADQEAQTRRILEFIGLPWDDACLDFHKTDRPVLTSSIGQVRRPIYKDSMERWRRYERHLGPLFEALGPDVLDRFGVRPS
ncbi:MAG: tetratricopeptide repeat protein [Magnetospiraceae bacterium]